MTEKVLEYSIGSWSDIHHQESTFYGKSPLQEVDRQETTFYRKPTLPKVAQKNRIELMINHYILSWKVNTGTWKGYEEEVNSEIPSTQNDKTFIGTELVERIHHLFKNPTNWDGYGTPEVSSKLREKCYEILKIVCVNKLDLPSIFPVCGGGLQFEWKHGTRDLELEFDEESISVLRTEVKEDGEIIYREKDAVSNNEIPTLIKWTENT